MIQKDLRSEPFTAEELDQFERDGYAILRNLFPPEELTPLAEYFHGEAVAGNVVENFWNPNPMADDPLERFPRVMHPHRYHELSKTILLDSRLEVALRALLHEEPLAGQSMFYFKPPGSRGQALHQDNRALQVRPGSCFAAWIAIDPSTVENGCLYVVPGTHKADLMCPGLADRSVSTTAHSLEVPEGGELVPVPLDPGDVLFFNGSLIHGSRPNTHPTLWRRAYILHYLPKSSQSCAGHFAPLFDFNGESHPIVATEGGGPCGGEYLPKELRDGAQGY